MRLHALQHVPFEGLGHIENWIVDQGHHLAITHLYNGEEFPRLDSFDGLVIMGGPMNIYEDGRYTWLKTERNLIRQAIDAGKSAIGICLGAQLASRCTGVTRLCGQRKRDRLVANHAHRGRQKIVFA